MFPGKHRACSRCGGPNDRAPQRYCRACHAAYMRANRPAHSELSEKERMKANARAYANSYFGRRPDLREPCERCGSEKAEKHHDDYRLPLAVRWLCRSCHLERHAHG